MADSQPMGPPAMGRCLVKRRDPRLHGRGPGRPSPDQEPRHAVLPGDRPDADSIFESIRFLDDLPRGP